MQVNLIYCFSVNVNKYIRKIFLRFINISFQGGGSHRKIIIQHLIQQQHVSLRYLFRLAINEARLVAKSKGIWHLTRQVFVVTFATLPKFIFPNAARNPAKSTKTLLQSNRVQLMVKSLDINMDKDEALMKELSNYHDESDLLFRLAEYQKERIKKVLDPNKKTVATFSPTGAYREQFGNIIQRLRDKGYNAITFLGLFGSQEYATDKNIFYAGVDFIGLMDFVDIFLCTEAPFPLLPTKATIVGFVHDINDSPPGNINSILNHILFFDYQFLPSSFVLNRVEQQVNAARSQLAGKIGDPRRVCLIPGGYIKLDKNVQYFEANGKESRTLIYAPTVIGAGFENLVSLDTYSDQIVEAILNNFPDYELIFRPHPHTVDSSYVRDIVQKYRANSRFIFDDNATFYMDNYCKAALMVSDMSGTAYTYALTTLRPVIFFSHNEKKVLKQMRNYKYFMDREKIGYVAFDINEMVKKIKFALDNHDTLTAKVKAYRDSTIYNVGSAEDYFLDNIEYIIENKKHTGWIYT